MAQFRFGMGLPEILGRIRFSAGLGVSRRLDWICACMWWGFLRLRCVRITMCGGESHVVKVDESYFKERL